MKNLVLIMMVVLGFSKAMAVEPEIANAEATPADVAGQRAPASQGSDTIIDPELMNKGVWAEPSFRGPNEAARETASDSGEKVAEKMPDEYLDVLEKIPTTDSAISRAWMEYKALSED